MERKRAGVCGEKPGRSRPRAGACGVSRDKGHCTPPTLKSTWHFVPQSVRFSRRNDFWSGDLNWQLCVQTPNRISLPVSSPSPFPTLHCRTGSFALLGVDKGTPGALWGVTCQASCSSSPVHVLAAQQGWLTASRRGSRVVRQRRYRRAITPFLTRLQCFAQGSQPDGVGHGECLAAHRITRQAKYKKIFIKDMLAGHKWHRSDKVWKERLLFPHTLTPEQWPGNATRCLLGLESQWWRTSWSGLLMWILQQRDELQLFRATEPTIPCGKWKTRQLKVRGFHSPHRRYVCLVQTLTSSRYMSTSFSIDCPSLHNTPHGSLPEGSQRENSESSLVSPPQTERCGTRASHSWH